MKIWMMGALTALTVGCATEHHPKTPDADKLAKLTVQVAPAREVTQALGDELVGTVRARSVTAISTSIMGTVRAVKVNLGSRVRAGDVLVQLSAGEIEAKANQAQAMFAQAELDMQRANQLKASKSIATSQYDAASAQFRVAEAALAEAQVMRGYTTIRAPVAGIVTAKQCDVGDLALPGKPLLVIENPESLRLEVSVPEAIAQRLTQGDVLPIHIDSIAAPLEGKVSELSPSADPATRTVLVKLDLPSLTDLHPGMFGRLEVQTGETRTVMVLEPAVRRRGQMETVFVVDKGKARLRLVRAGRTREGRTEILAGLEDGESVVVAQADLLVDGQPVETKP